MAGTNLTGMPSVWADLNLPDQNESQLSEEEKMLRKRKLMAAAGTTNSPLANAAQAIWGSRTPTGVTVL